MAEANIKVALIYDPDTPRVSVCKKEFLVQDDEHYPAPAKEYYLCVLLESGVVEFYRILGKKDGAIIATARYTEAVNDMFFARFMEVVGNSAFRNFFTVDSGAAEDEVDEHPVDETPVQQEVTGEMVEPESDPDVTDTPVESGDGLYPFAVESVEIVPSKSSSSPTDEVGNEGEQQKQEDEPALDQGVDYFPGTWIDDLPEKKNILSGLLCKRIDGKIFFMGDGYAVTQAQNRIYNVLKKANIAPIPYEEIITPRRLVMEISKTKHFMVVADLEALRSTSEGLDALRIMNQNNVLLLDLHQLSHQMRETEILSTIQNIHTVDVKSVLYTGQRVFMFVSNTGGVGKTTLSFNFAHWLASKGVHTMYMELLSGKGIDKVIGKDTSTLEGIFEGKEKPRPIELDSKSTVYCVSLADPTNGGVDNKNQWEKFFTNYIYRIDELNPQNKEIVRLRKDTAPFYHAVIIDTYSDSLSTRMILPGYVTDVVVVVDMRPTTTASQILDTIIPLANPRKQGGIDYDREPAIKKNFYFAFNQYRDNPRVRAHYEYTRAQLEVMAQENNVSVQSIRIDNNPVILGQIHIKDEKNRLKVVAPLVEAMYGIKI